MLSQSSENYLNTTCSPSHCHNGFMTTVALEHIHLQLHVVDIQKTKEWSNYHWNNELNKYANMRIYTKYKIYIFFKNIYILQIYYIILYKYIHILGLLIYRNTCNLIKFFSWFKRWKSLIDLNDFVVYGLIN